MSVAMWLAGEAGMISMKSMVRPGELTGNKVVPLFSVRLPRHTSLTSAHPVSLVLDLLRPAHTQHARNCRLRCVFRCTLRC